MAISLKSSRASVVYDGFVGQATSDLDREMRDMLGPIIDELQAEADAIIQNEIKPNWPIKPKRSRRSRDLWFTTQRADAEMMFVEVILDHPNLMKYVRFITNSTRVGNADDAVRPRKPLSVHVRKPATKVRRRLKRTLPVMLAELIERVANDGR